MMADIIDPINEFRNDHRKIRDGVLDIVAAMKAKDIVKARGIINNLNRFVGPHFRYEEESLYPALRKFLGNYMDELVDEHDDAIETTRRCHDLLNQQNLTDEDIKEAEKTAMLILVHVSNCDGLAILTERVSKEGLDALGQKFSIAREKNVPLFEWADTIREK